MLRNIDLLVGKFDSLAAFIDYASQPLGNVKCRNVDTSGWTGARTWDDAVNLAHGWREGAARIESLAARLNVKGDRVRKTVAMSETGPGVVSMGHFVSGHPQPYAVLRDTANTRKGKGKIVKVWVNLSASGMVDTDVIETRGAAVLALITGLERAGRRVEVTAVHSVVSSRGSRMSRETAARAVTLISLKAAHQKLNLPTLAFALMHPAMLRRFIFASRLVNRDAARFLGIDGRHSNSATPCDVEAPDGVLYMGALWGRDPQWQSPEAAAEWVRETLKAQGVKF